LEEIGFFESDAENKNAVERKLDYEIQNKPQ
jgi:hypothetical protein